MQRARIFAAAVEVVGEVGYEGMSVARVTGRARVSRRTFYDLFDGRSDCFLAVFGDAVARAEGVAAAGYACPGRWRERVRAGLGALLVLLDEEPKLASLSVVEALGAGRRVLDRRKEVLDRLAEVVDEGRCEARAGHGPAPLTAPGVVGAVLALVHARLLERPGRPLSDLLNPLMSMIVLPYLGPAAAARELARAPLPAPAAPQPGPRDPLDGLQMRLTYRTLRVLTAIAAQPAASNRQIAEAADIHDQGQISKLLGRLEHLGLIVNCGQGHTKGEPNAWQLTPRGQQIEHAIHTQTTSTTA